MQARELARIFGRELEPMLKAMNGFVLGPVISEHALDVGHKADKPDVGNEHRHAQDTVEDVPRKGVAVVVAHQQVGDEGGQQNEQGNAQGHAEHHGNAHLGLAEKAFFGILERFGVF